MSKKISVLNKDFAKSFSEYLAKVAEVHKKYYLHPDGLSDLVVLDTDIEAEIEMDELEGERVVEILGKDEKIREHVLDNLSDWVTEKDDWKTLATEIDCRTEYRLVKLENLNEELLYEKFENHLSKMRNGGVSAL